MRAIILKDLRVYFASPLASVTIVLFLFLVAFAFNAQLTQATPGSLPEASMRGLLYFIAVVLLFMTPFMSMRSFADESRQQTMELLKTSPIGDWQLVLAKFIAVWIFLSVLLLSTSVFPLLMIVFASPDLGPLFLSYLGLWLLGAAFLSLGLFMSSLVASPMIAALLTFVSLLLLWFVGGLDQEYMQQISLISHIDSFATGVLSFADCLYYILFVALFIFLTVRVQEFRRWK
jgi:ABC-2 type transport system permease protein